ncbi:MAG: MTH938/NDUFAF3 family protein [Rhodomicrobiaceae bacterium]
MELSSPLLTGRAAISGYGRGRFRIGGVEHSGSLLILPQGVYPWLVQDASGVSDETLGPVLAEGAPLGFLLLGTGAAQVFPAPPLREAFASAGLGLEAMDTGAACRTYNVLLAEERIFAAALIALS